MNERTALITGGARGIGRAVALDLASRGWSVAIAYRSSEEEADSVRREIGGHGVRAMAVRADVSDPAAAQALARRVESEWGRVDAVVHGAGPYHRVGLLEETVEGWNEMFDNNLHPVFYLSRALLPGMMNRRWGRVVTFALANADRAAAQPNVTAHFIAKVGVLVLTRSLARIAAGHGVTVNAISPGFIDSGSAPAEELASMAKKIPAGYVGSTEDAVAAVRFLMSEEARYVNGANIHLSGGWGI